jgi:hypothetical protein
MGFDFNIQVCFSLCTVTGKPYFWKKEKLEKDYNLPTIVVPEEHRRFLQLRGRFLHIYTDILNENNTFSADIDTLLDNFPTWEDIENDSCYSEYANHCEWTEEDHNNFKAALEWFQSQPYYYNADWSY